MTQGDFTARSFHVNPNKLKQLFKLLHKKGTKMPQSSVWHFSVVMDDREAELLTISK
jgi:hypothetical protein